MLPDRTPPNGTPPDWARFEIAVPGPSSRLPGITMAGFRQRARARWDITMVAHPCVTLFVDLGGGDGVSYDVHGRNGSGSVVVGLLPGEVRASGTSLDCLQIRLEPIAAAAVFGTSRELSGAMVTLEELWGRDAERAEEGLRGAASWEERFALAAQMLGRRMHAARQRVDPEVAYTWRRMLASRGRVRVEGLADQVGWSRKLLWSRFRSQLGVSPKRAARLVRFDHAAHLLAAGHAAADVAAVSGYVDQPHLNREVKAFTGLTPAAVAAAPFLTIDDVAWPASSPSRRLARSV